RVGRGAIDMRDARIVGVGIAIDAEQALARLALGHQASGTYVPALVVDRAVGKTEAADVAVAVEAGHPLVLRRPIIEIALHAIESALDVRGDLAPDLAVIDVGLEACGTVESGRKKRVTAKIDCHIPSSHQ